MPAVLPQRGEDRLALPHPVSPRAAGGVLSHAIGLLEQPECRGHLPAADRRSRLADRVHNLRERGQEPLDRSTVARRLLEALKLGQVAGRNGVQACQRASVSASRWAALELPELSDPASEVACLISGAVCELALWQTALALAM